ncbi:MAG: phosphotransferase [Armatimonadota bacterium]|nr:MAG: phosphotransferase [Armatimonadota bacterium]
MTDLHGDAGREWLRRLPDIVAECVARWSLTLTGPGDAPSYNYIVPALRSDGDPVILKLGHPHPELRSETDALAHYDGRGAARLLEADRDLGVLLLERLLPGAMLVSISDEERTTEIAASVMRALWRPAPPQHSFRSVEDWAHGMTNLRHEFDGGPGPFPAHLVDKAEGLFADLLPSQADRVLLHGDLHHYNILAAQRHPWLAIDPKGVVGEPAYEIGAFLRNPFDLAAWHDLPAVQARRLTQLSDLLGFDHRRLRAWAIAQAVLSAWWSYEDHGSGWESAITCAEALSAVSI